MPRSSPPSADAAALPGPRPRLVDATPSLHHRDQLTGLASRLLLEEHLLLALARARRDRSAVALVQLGLDGFRLVNDSLGRAGGDELLCAVAGRLGAVLRPTDLLARLGGDELVVLLADLPGDGVEAAETAAVTLLGALQEPFRLARGEVPVGATAGIALLGRDGEDGEALLRAAGRALERAKQVARGSFSHPAHRAGDPLAQLALSSRLRCALEAEALELHFQPIVELATGRIRWVEALLRWPQPPGAAPIGPDAFIPAAEATGLIDRVGDWVVGEACRRQAAWATDGLDVAVSFNVSPRQLRRLDFPARVAGHLARTGADPRRLTAELTESASVDEPETAEPALRRLHELGLTLALDDFGTGSSSLSRLRALPVEVLKVDREFLRDVPEVPAAGEVVRAVVAMGRALGRDVVAEGVETEGQRGFLLGLGCQLAQGYLFSRPLPAAELEALVRTRS